MLQVLLTVDTEVWPCPDPASPHPVAGLDEAYRRCVLGRTSEGDVGDYGLPYLLDSLRRHDLHGVFFVEPLSSSALGEPWLRQTVRRILDAGQEVQLHLHTEWLSDAGMPQLGLKRRPNLGDFSLDEQTAIVRHGLATLREAGATDVIALRAGNLGGNVDTPRAASAAGLSLDMSFDPTRGPDTRALIRTMCGQPRETACPTIPVSFVRDYPGHYRAAALTALSFGELRGALRTALRDEWPCFVILLHSFEFVRCKQRFGPLHPDRVNLKRWDKLCRFLARHRDVFPTVGCADLKPAAKYSYLPDGPRTQPVHTAWRMAEQLVSRFG